MISTVPDFLAIFLCLVLSACPKEQVSACSDRGVCSLPEIASLDASDGYKPSQCKFARTGMDLPLTPKNLMQGAIRIFKAFLHDMSTVEYTEGSMLPSELLAFLSAVIMSEVDVVIESGTGAGYGIEVVARFLEGTGISAYTIDDPNATFYQHDAGNSFGRKSEFFDVVKRLESFPHVKAVQGDAFEVIPQLLDKHATERVGILVDGPKDYLALHICALALNQTRKVKFCAVHDVSPGIAYNQPPYMWDLLEAWDRTALLTYSKEWRHYWKDLDATVPSYPGYEDFKDSGFGLAILKGTEETRWGMFQLDSFVMFAVNTMPIWSEKTFQDTMDSRLRSKFRAVIPFKWQATAQAKE